MAARYTRLDITDTEELRPKLAEPFATVFRTSTRDVDDSDGAGCDPGDAKREPTIFFSMSRVPVRHFGWAFPSDSQTSARR